MVDSHALVGSCAQIGQRVHLSAAAQIGGVLEPAGALPVIIEDEVLVGGNCGVYEGTIVRERAVLAPGTILTGGTAVFDLVHDRVYRRDGDRPLEIPAGAVVVPGTRPVRSGAGREARDRAVHAGDREVSRREDRDGRAPRGAAALMPMTAHTHYLWFETKRRQEIIDITDEVARAGDGQPGSARGSCSSRPCTSAPRSSSTTTSPGSGTTSSRGSRAPSRPGTRSATGTTRPARTTRPHICGA